MALRVQVAVGPDPTAGEAAPEPPAAAGQGPAPADGDAAYDRRRLERIRHAAEAALRDQGVRDAEVSVTLLPDAAIAELHARYLGRTGPTDVLAFPLHAPGEAPLGDVYIGEDQAARQASALGVPLDEELARLTIHGTLHVLGHVHGEGEDREDSEMWAAQERILADLLGG